jgi:hypothetical protein
MRLQIAEQVPLSMSYRFTYDPQRDSCLPIPIISLHALKEGIVE